MKYKELKENCKNSESIFILFLYKRILYLFKYKKNILAHHLVEIVNPQNININGLLKIGVEYFGFTSKNDKTLLNVRGELNFSSDFSIGKGCRFDIGPGAVANFGSGYVSPNTIFVITKGIRVGDHCVISWGCQFLDSDFHRIKYKDYDSIIESEIIIGDRVWIGSNSYIYKGVKIPNGCIIASNSVVKASFDEENVLIGGNPAKILKRNISWEG